MMRGPLYASYDERTCCIPVMMRGPVVCLDERTCCTLVMMRNVLYTSYDERTYCTPVIMRGPVVCQLCVGRNRDS